MSEPRGELRFEAVTLGTDRSRACWTQVSFTARPGQTVALVGGSGVGKSTIAYLATRLLDPDAGVVRLDGHDLRDLTLAERAPAHRAGRAGADAAPRTRSRRTFATCGRTRPATRSGGPRRPPGIAAFIEALPQGYATVAGERGLAVSAGERQRIALARAFLADPAVLVMDEPTAALDAIAQRQVIDGSQAVMRGRTIVLITHRREVAMAADHVVVLDGARVVDAGAAAPARGRGRRRLRGCSRSTCPTVRAARGAGGRAGAKAIARPARHDARRKRGRAQRQGRGRSP